ncbi:helix-turn-helix transcriptional regulator [Niameybacter massiliensis]|uniref:helix-turn-helix transcriptional regulator n=1 Tax=Niameybacter massiliensis TaxID=1658108 RepID=UPI0006B61CD6|nr:AraC family transcriptional regulator [Niameybacter massiliensis]
MHPIVQSSKVFRETLLKKLSFVPHKHDHCILYKDPNHPENGYFLFYERPGYYSFGIADYTIPHAFKLIFDNPEHLIRFGSVYQGATNFKLENQPVSSFTPSSFFVMEKGIKGQQVWTKGQHFHGAEFTIHETYFTEVLEKQLHTSFSFDKFNENFTYRYLPLDIMSLLKKMHALANQNALSLILLESYLLQCIAILMDTVNQSPDNAFTKQLHYGKVKIGTNKYLHLSSEDIRSIQKAHAILTENIQSPPTIEHLSELVLLNTQKLKAGFSYYYHLPIGQFITSTRMSLAANLLCTTDESISEIAKQVGYPYTSNFIKMFKQTYHCTPLEYRHNSRI